MSSFTFVLSEMHFQELQGLLGLIREHMICDNQEDLWQWSNGEFSIHKTCTPLWQDSRGPDDDLLPDSNLIRRVENPLKIKIFA